MKREMPDTEHTRKYEHIAQELGVPRLLPLVPAGPAKVTRCLETDEHLNNIPLKMWDAAAGFGLVRGARVKFPEDADSESWCKFRGYENARMPNGDRVPRKSWCLTLSEAVCVLKHVAKYHMPVAA